jgi:hypothetical protein
VPQQHDGSRLAAIAGVHRAAAKSWFYGADFAGAVSRGETQTFADACFFIGRAWRRDGCGLPGHRLLCLPRERKRRGEVSIPRPPQKAAATKQKKNVPVLAETFWGLVDAFPLAVTAWAPAAA